MNKTFAIFKALEKKTEKSPDYLISMKVGDKFVNIGGAWIKDAKNGKYLSCKLSESYADRKSYAITEVVEEKQKVEITKHNDEEIPF